MSLILEALKKLDREKQAPERGFVVVGAAPWGSRERPGRLAVGGLVAAAVGVAIALTLASRPSPAPPPAGPHVGAVAPVAIDRSAAGGVPASPAKPSTPSPRAVTGPAPPLARSPLPTMVAARPPDATRMPAPAAAPAASLPPVLKLVAISQRDGRPVALLNDRLVREGDSFDGVTVVRIGSDEVEVEVGGQRRVIGF